MVVSRENTITSLHKILTHVPNILSQWISKPRRQRHKKRDKTSHGAVRFAQNLCACKESWYNERNCKSGRHNQHHIFVHCKSWNKNTSTDMPNLGLEVKGRNKVETKFSSLRDQILCAIHYCQNTNCQEPTNISQSFLPYDEPDLFNDLIFKELGYTERFCINSTMWAHLLFLFTMSHSYSCPYYYSLTHYCLHR